MLRDDEMQDDDMIEANRQYYRRNAERYDVDEQPFIHQREFVRRLLREVESFSPNVRILDFGAGTGSSTETLVAAFPSAGIIGLDLSPEMLSIASRKCPTVSFNLYDGKRVPFGDNWFDGVLVSSVLHHVRDYKRALVEIVRVTRANGWIIVTQEPNPRVNKLVNLFRRLFQQDVPPLLKCAEGYQFCKDGGIPPRKIIDSLEAHGFSCELIYNNDALLDSLHKSHRVLYRLIRFASFIRVVPCNGSYNIVARRPAGKANS